MEVQTAEPLLQVSHLCKTFYKNVNGHRTAIRAIDDVSFEIQSGQTMALVGESGSGKTTTGRAILQLTTADSGTVSFDGTVLSQKNISAHRAEMQIIFQNPAASLDPRMDVYSVIAEGLRAQCRLSRSEEAERIGQLLEQVGLAKSDAGRFPGSFSGGQQQRISIARALAVRPRFLVCDEPVSALDVSYQAQIINMLKGLQAEHGLTYLFISHDLAVVANMADTIGVMYLGQLLESGPANEVLHHPAHPYTRELLDSVPIADPRKARERKIKIRPVQPTVDPNGCRYRPRCPYASAECSKKQELVQAEPGHFCRCRQYGKF